MIVKSLRFHSCSALVCVAHGVGMTTVGVRAIRPKRGNLGHHSMLLRLFRVCRFSGICPAAASDKNHSEMGSHGKGARKHCPAPRPDVAEVATS